MNFLHGEMTATGFRVADGPVLPIKARSQDAVTLGIRPEHLRRDPDGIVIEIIVVEPTGAETQVVGKLGSQALTGLLRERSMSPPARSSVSYPS